MTKLNKLYKELEKKYKSLERPDKAFEFADIADKIILEKDIDSFAVLLKYFDDNTEYVWEHIKTALENFDDKTYVKGVLLNLHYIFPHAKNWSKEMLYII